MKNFVNTKFVIAIMMIVSVMMVTSCQQDDELVTPVMEEKMDNNNLASKVSYSGGYPVYEVDPLVMNHFKHYCQLDAYRQTPRYLTDAESRTACGPTAYMMAAYTLAKYNDFSTSYECSGKKLGKYTLPGGTIVNGIFPTVKNYVGAGSITLPSLKWYGDSYDYSFIKTDKEYTINRENIKNFIKNSLGANKFVIVSVNALCYNATDANNVNLYSNGSSNKDLNVTGNVVTGSNRNYIVSLNENGSNVGGHIIVIVKFVQRAADGSGYIEYLDPIANTRTGGLSNRRYVSFTRLLDSMAWNGVNDTQYDAISLGL